jgi:hypothetical protein
LAVDPNSQGAAGIGIAATRQGRLVAQLTKISASAESVPWFCPVLRVAQVAPRPDRVTFHPESVRFVGFVLASQVPCRLLEIQLSESHSGLLRRQFRRIYAGEIEE